jgi:hypothetical protein
MKVQTGFIQTHLDASGKLMYYRCTVPIPSQVVPMINVNSLMVKGKRYFFIYASPDWDDLQYQIAAIQYTVNEYKMQLFRDKMAIALSKLTSIK